MKIARTGGKLSVTLNSGISYNVTFDHNCGSEADAEAWRVHLQNWQDRQEAEKEARLESGREKVQRYESRIATLKRANAALRGHNCRLRKSINAPERDDAPGESTSQPTSALCSNADQAAAGSSVTFDWKGKAITLQPARLPGGALVRYADEHWVELQKHRKLIATIRDDVEAHKCDTGPGPFQAMCRRVLAAIQEIDA